MSSQINTLESLLSTARDLELFLERSLEFKLISIAALEQVLGRAREAAEAVATELADKRKMITDTEAALEEAKAAAPPAEEEKPVAAATPVAAAARGRIDWKKQTLTLVSGAELLRIVEDISSGVLTSGTASVHWRGKHHPGALFPAKIIYALSNAQNKTLSFTDLAEELGGEIGLTGIHSLQNYLRELYKQGIVLVA